MGLSTAGAVVLVSIALLLQFWIALDFMSMAGRRWPFLKRWKWLLIAAYLLVVGACLGLMFRRAASLLPLPDEARTWLRSTVQLWVAVATAGWLLYRPARWVVERLSMPESPARRDWLTAVAAAAAMAPIGVAAFAVITRKNWEVREVEVPVSDLPPGLAGIRIAQVSDIHLSPFLHEREFAGVIDQVNEFSPHVAFVTGDLITSRDNPIRACLRQIARIKADAGVFGCLGNHEAYAELQEFTVQEGARLGLRFLRSQNVTLSFGSALLNVVGVDYEPVSRRGRYLRGAEKLIRPGAVNLLLAHNPDVFPQAAEKGFDLTLSGHTHGGQITVEIFRQSMNIARYFTKYVYGLYGQTRDGAQRSIYVTSGVGTITLPARLGAPPEVVFVRLKNGS